MRTVNRCADLLRPTFIASLARARVAAMRSSPPTFALIPHMGEHSLVLSVCLQRGRLVHDACGCWPVARLLHSAPCLAVAMVVLVVGSAHLRRHDLAVWAVSVLHAWRMCSVLPCVLCLPARLSHVMRSSLMGSATCPLTCRGHRGACGTPGWQRKVCSLASGGAVRVPRAGAFGLRGCGAVLMAWSGCLLLRKTVEARRRTSSTAGRLSCSRTVFCFLFFSVEYAGVNRNARTYALYAIIGKCPPASSQCQWAVAVCAAM